jgi:thiol-disulfide isomerase/thioredoxin/sugar lactone lactonase YvrE
MQDAKSISKRKPRQIPSRPLWLAPAAFAAVALAGASIFSFQKAAQMPALRAEVASINAPEFPAGFAWHNTAQPLSMRALKGKVVLLDFWTYGCINCVHILPDLKKLERKYANELVVIGVHSAKFANESDAANIRNALLRYNIEHPVVVDQKMRLWNEYTVNVWPSFVLVDPAGKIVGQTAGEGQYDLLDRTIAQTVKTFKERGLLNQTPLKFALEAAKTPATPLWYPGKVLAQEGHVFIADTNHNRVVIARPDGQVLAVAGSGERGASDGSFEEATFSAPQGLALKKDANGALTLFVADTNNHLIRALDLNSGKVSTVAGSGKQAKYGAIGGMGTQTELSSPWDVLLSNGTLFVAMAGPHQIWAMDLKTSEIAPWAGSGREARIDGSRATAALAQPSGLALGGGKLYFADSESSSVRYVEVEGGRVGTLAGGDPNSGDLFTFGDRNGAQKQALLQHPLGVAVANDGRVFIADTYNHKIKVASTDGKIATLVGKTRGDAAGETALFNEPGGLSLDGGKLYVADTNNHKVKVVDIATRKVSTLSLRGLPQPKAAEPSRPVRAENTEAGTIKLAPTKVKANGVVQVLLDIALPSGHHLNDLSPQRVQARVENRAGSSAQIVGDAVFTGRKVTLPLKMSLKTGASGSGDVVLSAAIYYCTDALGVCKVKTLRLRAPFEAAPDGGETLRLSARID